MSQTTENITSNNKPIEYRSFRFNLIAPEETKALSGKAGIIKGYASTFGNIDRGDDVIVKGAFVKSIDWYRQQGKKIPICWQHDMDTPIGGINPQDAFEDDKGLNITGTLLIDDIQKAAEIYALIKEGIVSDFSIGFSCNDYELVNMSEFTHGEKGNDYQIVRKIKEVMLWEISPVVVPMNPQANITDVKNAVFDFPMAEKGTKWNEDDAISNIKKATQSENGVTEEYKKCFLYFDGKNSNDFGSYHLPFVDVVKGKLRAIPHAIFCAGKMISTGNHDLKVVDENLLQTKVKINKYYEKLGAEIPFKSIDIDGVVAIDDLQLKNKSNFIDDKELMDLKKSQIEKILRETGRFSRNAAKCLVSCLDLNRLSKNLDRKQVVPENDLTDLLHKVKQRDAANNVKNKNINPILASEMSSLLHAIRNNR